MWVLGIECTSSEEQPEFLTAVEPSLQPTQYSTLFLKYYRLQSTKMCTGLALLLHTWFCRVFCIVKNQNIRRWCFCGHDVRILWHIKSMNYFSFMINFNFTFNFLLLQNQGHRILPCHCHNGKHQTVHHRWEYEVEQPPDGSAHQMFEWPALANEGHNPFLLV